MLTWCSKLYVRFLPTCLQGATASSAVLQKQIARFDWRTRKKVGEFSGFAGQFYGRGEMNAYNPHFCSRKNSCLFWNKWEPRGETKVRLFLLNLKSYSKESVERLFEEIYIDIWSYLVDVIKCHQMSSYLLHTCWLVGRRANTLRGKVMKMLKTSYVFLCWLLLYRDSWIP